MGGGGSMRNMNRKVQENRNALKSSDHNQSYLKANSIRNNRKVSSKHAIGIGIGFAMTCIVFWFGMLAISNYKDYENSLPHEVTYDKTQEAYLIIMVAADYKMEKGYYKDALKEYENALKIYPKDSAANQGLIRAAQLAFN